MNVNRQLKFFGGMTWNDFFSGETLFPALERNCPFQKSRLQPIASEPDIFIRPNETKRDLLKKSLEKLFKKNPQFAFDKRRDPILPGFKGSAGFVLDCTFKIIVRYRKMGWTHRFRDGG